MQEWLEKKFHTSARAVERERVACGRERSRSKSNRIQKENLSGKRSEVGRQLRTCGVEFIETVVFL